MAQQDILLTDYTTLITPAEVQAALPDHVYEIDRDWVTVWGRKGERAVLAWVAAEDARRREAAVAVEAELPSDTPMATEKQIEYIRALIARRQFLGEDDGFMQIPAEDALVHLTRRDASTLIDSLTGRY